MLISVTEPSAHRQSQVGIGEGLLDDEKSGNPSPRINTDSIGNE